MGQNIIDDPKGMGRKGGLARVANERARLAWLFGDGKDDYEEYARKQDRLKKGEELSKPEMQWMQNFRDTLEYNFPKLARTESKVEVKGSLFGLGHDELKKQND